MCVFERQRNHKTTGKETDRWRQGGDGFDSRRTACVTPRGVSANLMSRQRSMGPAAGPSAQMVKPTSSRAVVRTARLASVDVSLAARLNATAPLKPEGRGDISEQTAGSLPSIKPPRQTSTNQLLGKKTVNNPVCVWVTYYT